MISSGKPQINSDAHLRLLSFFVGFLRHGSASILAGEPLIPQTPFMFLARSTGEIWSTRCSTAPIPEEHPDLTAHRVMPPLNTCGLRCLIQYTGLEYEVKKLNAWGIPSPRHSGQLGGKLVVLVLTKLSRHVRHVTLLASEMVFLKVQL